MVLNYFLISNYANLLYLSHKHPLKTSPPLWKLYIGSDTDTPSLPTGGQMPFLPQLLPVSPWQNNGGGVTEPLQYIRIHARHNRNPQ